MQKTRVLTVLTLPIVLLLSMSVMLIQTKENSIPHTGFLVHVPEVTIERENAHSFVDDSQIYSLVKRTLGKTSNFTRVSVVDESMIRADIIARTAMTTDTLSLNNEQIFEATDIILPSIWQGSAAWGDYDGDNDLDILLTSGYSMSGIFRNDGNNVFTDISAGLETVNGGSGRWGDYDNDGDLDILLVGSNDYNIQISKVYRNDENGLFTDINAPLTGIWSDPAIAWEDYDNDGDLDIMLAGLTRSSKSFTKIYRNDGNDLFRDVDIIALENISINSMVWGDYDNDDDLDILWTGWISGTGSVSKIYRNDGNDAFFDINATLQNVNQSSVAWGDYDNDGDLDILLAGWSDSIYEVTRIYRNDGNEIFTDINAPLVNVARYPSAAWGDYDNDGDLDILIGGCAAWDNDFGGCSNKITRVYRNDQHETFTDINIALPNSLEDVLWGDYDNDGDLDILLAGNTTQIYRNITSVANTIPTSPHFLRTSVTDTSVIFNWDEAHDAESPSSSLTYNLRVGTSPGGAQVVAPMSSENGYRHIVQLGNSFHGLSATVKNLSPGTYYWTVQAIDTVFSGSSFANESSFTIAILPNVPTLNTIANADGDGTYAVSWNNVSNATSYTLQEASSSSFTNAYMVYTGSNTSTTINEKAPGTYYYRVRASNTGGSSGWSNTQTAVIVAPPSAPTLNTIANADGDGTYTVSWSSVSNATGYVLQEASNSSFTNASAVYTSNNTSTTLNEKAPGTYYYRVRASNAGGNSVWSNVQAVNVVPLILGDVYEPDDTCTQASLISTDGLSQIHTFHQEGDEDWVIFQATASTAYRIEAQVPPGSLADVSLEVYGQCAGAVLEEQDYTFSPGVVQEFTATASGSIYLRWINHNPAIYGDTLAYHLSVRALEPQATSGAVIIVAGRLKAYDDVQPNIHYISNEVYQLFQGNGYSADRIAYLATDLSLPGVDAPATAANLQEAITTWALDKVDADHSLTLYLVDHGTTDMLYLDEPSGQWVTSTQLDSWLTQLETARPGLKVNVIIEACKSGSFIKLEQTISKKGRVIITSTGSTNDAYAPRPGAVFSDRFIAALKQGQSLHQSFLTAKWATEIAYSAQTPWLDDGGNGIPNETTDGPEAAQRGFGLSGTLAGEIWPPYIEQGVAPVEIDQGSGILRAQVLDDLQVKRVWAVIYAPSYQPPPSGDELVNEVLPTIVLQSQGNDWYAASYPGFNEMGVYRVVIYAEDYDGWEARPLAVEVRTGWAVYLPFVRK